MDDLLGEFLVESIESISLLDNELLSLEKDPNNKEILKSIFRILHTIKGTCGFIGLSRLEKIAHAGETVLVKLRDEKMSATPKVVTLILECIDAVKDILNVIAEQETEPDGDDSDLIRRLNKAAEDENSNEVSQLLDLEESFVTGSDLNVAPPELEELFFDMDLDTEKAPISEVSDELSSQDEASTLGGNSETNPSDLTTDEEIFDFYANQTRKKEEQFYDDAIVDDKNHDGKNYGEFNIKTIQESVPLAVTGESALVEGVDLSTVDASMVALEDIKKEKTDDKPKMNQPVEKVEVVKPFNILENSLEKAEQVEKKDEQKTKTPGNSENAVAASNIRVSVKLLEDLMSQVSELVLTRNQILQTFKEFEVQEAKACLRRLDQITSELHEGITKTRMQPISNAWVKLPRLVRDLAIETSKKVELVMIGSETELDRQVIELIKDPLTHMLRNSVDHGLETPEVRVKNGKPESGTITLNAYHEGGMIILLVSDDGKGLPVDKIKEKAILNGLTTPQFADTLSESQIYQFIFKPGFSTAEAVTNVSGRGVGMDVVRSNIEKISGSIDVQSFPGKGTLFTIKIPLTLAIVSALLIEVDGHHFAMPQINVQELIKISGNTENCVDYVSGKPLLRLRDQLIPLVMLRDLLKLGDKDDPGKSYNSDQSSVYIMVIQAANNRIGIIVDKIHETQEIVVKPVSSLLRHISVYSGNTILGDGKIVMILDPNEIISQMYLTSMKSELSSSYSSEINYESKKQKKLFMIFRMKENSAPMAIPLFEVIRVETIEMKDIESINEHPLMQYHGTLIPLVILENPTEILNSVGNPILIINHNMQTIGLVVHSIDDIFEDENDVSLRLTMPGKKGVIVLNGLATDIIDSSYYLENMHAFFKPAEGIVPDENAVNLISSNSNEGELNVE